MSDIGQIERRTQQRVVTLFRERLGYDWPVGILAR